jgi:hypothetical protein
VRWPTVLVLGAAALAGGCGASVPAGVAPIGRGPGYELASLTRATAAGQPLGALSCGAPGTRPAAWVHVELFARGRVVLLPPGIGIAPPRRAQGAYVRGGRCRYPLWTDEPTGLVAVGRAGLTLDDLFRVWGRDLSATGAAGFKGPVIVHVDGRRQAGDPGAVALTPHAQIVLQVGGPLVPPHAEYTFP